MFRKILVATHGTEGARQAEACAISLAESLGAELHGLYVIHQGWGSLVGIEWLHPSETRMAFYRYAENELYRRAGDVLEAFAARAGRIPASREIVVGEPADAIARSAREQAADLIVIGGTGLSRSEEYQARVSLKKLMKRAPCPVLVAKGSPASLLVKGGDTALYGACAHT